LLGRQEVVAALKSGRPLLALGVSIITGLFALFGGFLTNTAPPDPSGEKTGASFAVGLASFVALIILFVVGTLATTLDLNGRTRRLWPGLVLISGILFIATGLWYGESFRRATFIHHGIRSGEPIRLIAGREYLPIVLDYVRKNGPRSPEQLMQLGGTDDPNDIWIEASILANDSALTRLYQALVILLCLCLFSLLHLPSNKNKPHRRR
jgi:hypothetical protein